MPRHVLKGQYEGTPEPDENEDETTNEDEDFDHYDAGNEYIRESAVSPPTPNIEGVSKDNFTKGVVNGTSKNPPHRSNGLFDGKLHESQYMLASELGSSLTSSITNKFLVYLHQTSNILFSQIIKIVFCIIQH